MRSLELEGKCRLAFGDESGFTPNPPLCRAWAPKGEPHAHQMKTGTRQRLNAIGCCGWDLGVLSMGYVEGKVSGVDFRKWLRGFARSCQPQCPTHLWLDNGPIHKSAKSMELIAELAREGLAVHFLPPYSPELNRIEMLWRLAKKLRPFKLLEMAELRSAIKAIMRRCFK